MCKFLFNMLFFANAYSKKILNKKNKFKKYLEYYKKKQCIKNQFYEQNQTATFIFDRQKNNVFNVFIN